MPKKSKVIVYTIADNNNLPYAKKLEAMFKYWHKDIEFKIFGQEDAVKSQDKDIFYRATPYYAKQLFTQGYEILVKIDADTFIFGDLSHLWEEDRYDMGVVYNWNRTDPKTYGLINVWDIPPQQYFNNGLVVMRSPKFVDWWWHLCKSNHFYSYPMREQDLLNIMIHYHEYLVKILDNDCWHGLVSKGEQLRFIVKDNQVILPKSNDNYPDKDKIIKAYHMAGGNMPTDKMNYRIYFPEDVIKFIDKMLCQTKSD